MVQKKSNSSKAKAKHGARTVATGASAKKEKVASGGPPAGKSQQRQQKGQQKKERPSDKRSFDEQLQELGLRVKEVTADGNCFFRAVADQLEGKEFSHASYRQRVVDFIECHKDDFEPFVEDDVPFAEYCTTMREDATWAGNLELQAASLLLSRNICIHQLREPRWNIVNFEGGPAIHLSYHDGVHYNSVRLLDDHDEGPAQPIIIEADHAVNQRQVAASSKDTSAGVRSTKEKRVRATLAMVAAGSGCSDESRIAEVLKEVDGDAAAAIEYLIAQRNAELDLNEEPPEAIPQLGASASGDAADLANGVAELSSVELIVERLEDLAVSRSAASPGAAVHPTEQTGRGGHSQEMPARQVPRPATAKEPTEEVRVSRNKPCPCGSKKKYKACCGTGISAPSPLEQKQKLTNKDRKEQQRHERESQNTKAHSRLNSSQELGNNGSGDLGSLCI